MDFSKITVFTPTYNRALFLKKVYDSLVRQTVQNFEWVVVDDGSKDNTKEVVENFQRENKLPINYCYQNNAGKHIAINKGVSLAKGKLFLILDSDDFLPENSLETITHFYELHKTKENFGGVVGRRKNIDGNLIGTKTTIESIYETTLNLRYSHQIWGDFAEAYLTSVLQEFPFPHIENERFVPEGIVWNRIAQKYKVLFINQGIYFGEYLPDGLTSKMVKIRMRSPQLAMKYYEDLLTYAVPKKEKVKAIINFWRFAFHHHKTYPQKIKTLGFFRSILGIPLGFLMYMKDKYQYK